VDRREYWRAWYQKLKENPEKYREYVAKRKEYQKRYREKKKSFEEKGVVKMEEKKQEPSVIKQTTQETEFTEWQKQMLVNDIAWTKYELSRGTCIVNEDIFNGKLRLAHQLGLDDAISSKLRSLLMSKDW